MGTIMEREKKDGATSYTAVIRKKKGGKVVLTGIFQGADHFTTTVQTVTEADGSRVRIRATEDHFVLNCEMDVFENDERAASRNWNPRIPRRWV